MTDAKKPVIVRLASGAEYGMPSAAVAKKAYPNADIIAYQDGTPYEEPKKPAPKKAAAKKGDAK